MTLHIIDSLEISALILPAAAESGMQFLPRPAFGKSYHCSILLLSAYRQRLKWEAPVYRTVHCWSDQSEAILQDCFDNTDWDAFKAAGNLNDHTDTVTSYIKKCTGDVVPIRKVKIMPNQEPWLNNEVRTALHSRLKAHQSGSQEEYKKAKYALMATIRQAKREYSQRTKSRLITTNPRHLWCGLRAITDYRGNTIQTPQITSTLPDELNAFYARFEPPVTPTITTGPSLITTPAGEQTLPRPPSHHHRG